MRTSALDAQRGLEQTWQTVLTVSAIASLEGEAKKEIRSQCCEVGVGTICDGNANVLAWKHPQQVSAKACAEDTACNFDGFDEVAQVLHPLVNTVTWMDDWHTIECLMVSPAALPGAASAKPLPTPLPPQVLLVIPAPTF